LRFRSALSIIILAGSAAVFLLALLGGGKAFSSAGGTAAPEWERAFSHALTAVQPYLDRYGYAAIFAAILVEGVGLLAPGQSLLIAGGLMAAKGGLGIMPVLLWGYAAAVIGPCLGYLLGRWGGLPLLQRLHLNKKHLDRFTSSFDRYGPGLILLARFCDGLRQLHGFVAGLAQMPGRQFLAYSFLGAAFWIGFWGGGAYLLERSIGRWHLRWQSLQPWILALSLLACLAGLIWLLRPAKTAS